MKKIILVIVIMSLLLSVCSCASSNSKEIESLNQKISELEKQGESTTTVSTTAASVQGETTSQPSSSDAANNPEVFSNIEYLPQTKTLEEMKAIDNIEDWAKLSPVDRAAYYILTNDIGDKGILANSFNAYVSQHSFEEAISLFGIGSLKDALSTAYYKDGMEAAKLAAVSYYYTESANGEIRPAYKEFAEMMYNDTTKHLDTSYVFISSGTPRQIGKDIITGKEITFTNVTYRTETQKGKIIADEQTVQIIEVPVRLMTGEEVIILMEGLGVYGKASPDNNYPY